MCKMCDIEHENDENNPEYLRMQREAAMRDAERYRWIKDHPHIARALILRSTYRVLPVTLDQLVDNARD